MFFRPQYVIIREVYDQVGLDDFESELDRALDVQTDTIIIEPMNLGLETARWISVGNFLHKASVLSGLGTLLLATRSDNLKVLLTTGGCSLMCATVYFISWQFDPCCKYQVETNISKIDKLPMHKLSSTSPIVLVRKDDKRRKVLHNTLAALSFTMCLWKVYKKFSQ